MRRSQTELDHTALAAIAAIGLGWFAMATLVVNLGLWQQSIHFYDLLAVVNDPAGRLTGINRAHPLMTLFFVLVCGAAVSAPLAPLFSTQRAAWLGYLVPFILMALSCAVLYTKTSASYFHADDTVPTVSTFLARVAQSAVARASDVVATHISIGAGAYIALLASGYLALRGVCRFRAASSLVTGASNDRADLAPGGHRDAGARQIEP
jgi:hypothetical protein